MRVVAALVLGLCVASVGPSLAQESAGPVPGRRIVVTEGIDFYGGDLRAIFDTTFESCRAACLADTACRAFTFNARAGACFPKSRITSRQPFDGAISAEVFDTPPEVMASAAARAAELGFLRPGDLTAAREVAEQMAGLHPVGGFSTADYAGAAAAARGGDNLVDAVRFSGAAVVLSDAPDLWVAYAEDLLAARGHDGILSNREARAVSAAVNGYLRADDGETRAAALLAMARALEATGRGRNALAALRLAADLSPRQDIAEARDRAAAMFGFRIVEHVVESDPATARICAAFSEPLAEAGVDYGPFVQVSAEGTAVEVEDNRLCIAGVRHGERYRVTFRSGLPSAAGDRLAGAVNLDLYVRDRSPAVRFPGRAYVLPRTGDPSVPVVTVNASTIELVLRRISDRNILRAIQDGYFGRPLDSWQEEQFSDRVAEEVWRGTGIVGGALNEDTTTRLPMAQAIAGQPPGIYALQARIPGQDPHETAAATQWFVVSDLGLATLSGTDGLHVFVRALGTAEPREGITVTLVSRANAVLGTATTDAEGHAFFPAGLTRGTGAAAPGLVTAEDGSDDIAFLSLTDPEFDLSDRGVEGREAAPPIDLFLATDRGAYRAGETIHATALARDGGVAAIDGLPLTAILSRPDGVEYSRALSDAGRAGGHVFAMPVAGSAPRGAWTLAIHADPQAPPLAKQTVLVEDFLPERIDFTLSLPDAPIAASDRPTLSIEARYLFGAPAADLAIDGSVQLAAVRTLEAFPGYLFGRHDAPFDSRYGTFEPGLRTDPEGRAAFPLTFPEVAAADRPLEARITVTVAEGSGRPVERRLTRALSPAAPLIGIRPAFDGVVPEGGEAHFDVIAVGPDGARAAMPVRWTLNRIETTYQWYQVGGQWEWEPVTARSRVASGEAQLSPDAETTIAAPVDWGHYELRVDRADGSFAASSVDFHAGWYAPADASDTPDTLEVSLDRPAYAPGDTATVRIVPRFAGKGLVTVMSNRLIAMQAVELAEGENLVRLPVTDDWGTGVYVAATVIRPMDVAAGRNPARALGLAHAAIDPGGRRLSVAFEAPAEAEPRAPLDVALRVAGAAPGQTAWATIAAVDVGILNLTGFESPDPEGHYFGQRKLGVGIRDVYGRLIDGMTGSLGRIRSGGDGLAARRIEGPPPTEDLVAWFSGPLEVGPDGLARASIPLPAFNGTVRLMAIAWTATAVGQAEHDVLVRDPVVVTATVPRFLAPGDSSRVLLELVHARGPAGPMQIELSASPGLTLGATSQRVDLADRGRAILSVPLSAGAAGIETLSVALTTPGGRRLTRALTVPVAVNDPPILRQSRFALAAGETFTLDGNVFAGLFPGTGSATLSAGPLARFDAPGLLRALDRYPYGCTEQIAAAAMPLLYFEDVAAAMGLGGQSTARQRVEEAITEVLTNQAPGGSFGLWGPEAGDLWLDAFVSDFLSRAKARGYTVPDTAFRQAMDNLRNQVNYYPDFERGGEDLAYALFVLAREGAAAVGDLRYYADVKGDAFATPLAAAQIGAALAAYGDATRADAMFARAERLLGAPPPDETLWRADYGTRLRDTAAVLALAVDAGSQAVDRDGLAALIANAAGPLSTQERVWTLLAAHALIERPVASLSVNGVPVEGPFVRTLDDAVAAAPLSIRHDGPGEELLTLSTFGVPAEPEPQGGNGWRIDRRYYTLDGAPADPASVPIGTRLVTVIEVAPFGPREARLMVNDPLPAGFEIDNPNLLRMGDLRALDWLAPAEARHAEFRADRFLAAVDHYGEEPFRLAYIVRAVSPGSFHHPAASVEDMYRPIFTAWTAAGRVTVTQ